MAEASAGHPGTTLPGSASTGEAALPRSFGRYTLVERIGQGGTASIFLARQDTALGATRLVVVKQILPAYASDPRFSSMLIHEAKLAAQLSHRCIVQVFDLGRTGAEDDALFIAMEYVEGFDLHALLRLCTQRAVALPVEFALGIVIDILDGLDHAHRRMDERGAPLGIIHRDVSPSNILVSYDGEVKLCDFGIAHANTLLGHDEDEALKGKAGYMSPEHARGESLDARADVFASGIVLWELLSGRRLYRSDHALPLLEQAQRAEISPVVGLEDKGLTEPALLQGIVARALAPNKAERFASAGAFRSALEDFVAQSSLVTSPLRLRHWLEDSFGTELAARRMANERRLPKATDAARQRARAPLSLAPVSAGAMRAFRRQLEVPVTVTHPEAEPDPFAEPLAEVETELALPPATPAAPLRSPWRRWGLPCAVAVAIAAAGVAIARALVQ